MTALRTVGIFIALWIVVNMLIAFKAPASGETQPQERADVLLTAIGCKQDSGESPTLQYSSWNANPNAPPWSPLTAPTSMTAGNGIYRLSFSLPPGKYLLRAHTSHCTADARGTLLPSTTRHFVLPLSVSRIVILSASCAIAGTLPTLGISAALLSKSGENRAISVDGNVYDAERLGRGTYTLRLTLAQGVVADYVFDLSKEPDGEFCENTFIRNISMDDLRRDAYFLTDDGRKRPVWQTASDGR
jgi:hypothetical protein